MSDTSKSNTPKKVGAQHFTSADFAEVLAKAGDKPVMVDFFAQWCGPCKLAAPVIEQLADDYADTAVIGKVDVDEEQALAGQYGVMSIPTVIVFVNGEEVDRKIGFAGREGYVSMIEGALS